MNRIFKISGLLLLTAIVAIAQLAPYKITEIVSARAGGIMTNTQSSVMGRVVVPPGASVGVTAAFNSGAAGTGNVVFWLRSSYDTNYPTIWTTNLTFTVAGTGATTVVFPTNTSFGDYGFTQLVVSNAAGAPISNLTVRLYNLTP